MNKSVLTTGTELNIKGVSEMNKTELRSLLSKRFQVTLSPAEFKATNKATLEAMVINEENKALAIATSAPVLNNEGVVNMNINKTEVLAKLAQLEDAPVKDSSVELDMANLLNTNIKEEVKMVVKEEVKAVVAKTSANAVAKKEEYAKNLVNKAITKVDVKASAKASAIKGNAVKLDPNGMGYTVYNKETKTWVRGVVSPSSSLPVDVVAPKATVATVDVCKCDVCKTNEVTKSVKVFLAHYATKIDAKYQGLNVCPSCQTTVGITKSIRGTV